jgi:hypothetical protein
MGTSIGERRDESENENNGNVFGLGGEINAVLITLCFST